MAKPLTKVEDAVCRVRDSISVPQANALYQQALLLVGSTSRMPKAQAADGLPFYPDVHLTELEMGRSRRMLTNLHILTSRLLSTVPAIDIDGVPEVIAEAMTGYFKERVRGKYANGFIEEVRSAALSGNAFGLGYCQVVLKTDPATNQQRVSLQSHRPWYVVTDAAKRNVLESPFICFAQHMSVEDAVEVFGEKAEKYARLVQDDIAAPKRKVVRVWEYFDVETKKTRATRLLILGNLDSGITKVEENLFGCLPCAVSIGWTIDGLARPYGRVTHEIALELAIHDAERRWQDDLENGAAFTVADFTALEEDDVRQWMAGERNVIIRKIGKLTEAPIVRTPANPIDPNLMSDIQYLTAQYNQTSGITELDRGQMASRRTTAREIGNLQGNSEANRGSEALQVTMFLVRLCELVLSIGAKFDRCPVNVKVGGVQHKLNDPSEPSSWLDKLIGDWDYTVLLDTEALTSGDKDYKTSMRIAKLQTVMPFVGSIVNPLPLVKELLAAAGIDDLEGWLIQQPAPGAQQAMPGQQPMAPQSGGFQQPGGIQSPIDVAREGLRGPAY